MSKPGRVYVIYGQGGYLTSIGMSRLASRIAKLYPDSKVTTHSWKYLDPITADIRSRIDSRIPVLLIGYSLGGNSVTMIANRVWPRQIDLAVCYDPSRLGVVEQPRENVKRLLLYHNVDNEPEGHAVFKGPMVERTDISMWHLAICYSEELHQKTLAAIAKVLG